MLTRGKSSQALLSFQVKEEKRHGVFPKSEQANDAAEVGRHDDRLPSSIPISTRSISGRLGTLAAIVTGTPIRRANATRC